MDPFVTLTAAAVATKTLKVGTGVCLVNQRDTIQTAKLVASIDQISGGRFLFGIGIGWNAEEMEDHGTVFATRAKLVRERIEAMKLIWTKSKAEYHGELVSFPEMMTWPKPVQKPHPPVIVGGAYPQAARRAVRYGDGWIPLAGRPGQYGDVFDFVPKFREMLKEAGRDEASCPVTLFNVQEDADLVKRCRDLGVARVSVSLPAEKGGYGAAGAGPLGDADAAGERVGPLPGCAAGGWGDRVTPFPSPPVRRPSPASTVT